MLLVALTVPVQVNQIKCQAVSAVVELEPINEPANAIFILQLPEPHRPMRKSGDAVLALSNLPAVTPFHL